MIDRSIPNIHPFGNPGLRADGRAYDGWPDSPRIEELLRARLDDSDAQPPSRYNTKAVCGTAGTEMVNCRL
jgi:hypothetical protein